MNKHLIIVTLLTILQIAAFILIQYIYYGLSDDCTIAGDWYCSSATAWEFGAFLRYATMLLVPPVLIMPIAQRLNIVTSWRRLFTANTIVFVALCLVVFIYLVARTYIQTSHTA